MRVAAYCRVSTEEAGQLGSLVAQREFFEEYVKKHPDWTLVDIFADEGKSGTSIKKRANFVEMINRAITGDIDLIITKDVSRFARNTLDTLYHTRALKASGVGVIFINDNINTLENEGEFRLTIMASVAQEESRKTSERIKWGQRHRMERGVVFGNNSLFGYDIVAGKLHVNEGEANTVRLIFHKYVAEKKGSYTIARELTKEGIRPRFSEKWSEEAVIKILRNEKYKGDLVQGKSKTVDYLEHRKIKNDAASLVVIKHNHKPIVSRKTWNAAAEILESRAKYKKKALQRPDSDI